MNIQSNKEIVNEIIGKALDDIKRKTGIELDAKMDNRIFKFYSDDKIISLKLEEIESVVINSLNLQSIVSKHKLKTKSKKRNIVDAKIIFSYISRKYHYKLTEIGRFTNKHHTSIVHHVAVCKDLLKTNKDFKEKYLLVNDKINQLYVETI